MLYLLCPVWVVFHRVWATACSIFSFSPDPAVLGGGGEAK